jgi:hypothetical protein
MFGTAAPNRKTSYSVTGAKIRSATDLTMKSAYTASSIGLTITLASRKGAHHEDYLPEL